jgi:hypothetical protein
MKVGFEFPKFLKYNPLFGIMCEDFSFGAPILFQSDNSTDNFEYLVWVGMLRGLICPIARMCWTFPRFPRTSTWCDEWNRSEPLKRVLPSFPKWKIESDYLCWYIEVQYNLLYTRISQTWINPSFETVTKCSSSDVFNLVISAEFTLFSYALKLEEVLSLRYIYIRRSLTI